MLQISVIIPLYNKGKYIMRALDSVFAQTYQDFELIVVDDGSTDEGPEIVRRYTDPRLRLIQQANAGPGSARNRGIKETTAPYLAFLDADDEWLPEFLEVSVSSLKTHPCCVVSVASHYRGVEKVEFTERANLHVTEGPWRFPLDISVNKVKSVIDFFHSGATLSRRDAIVEFGGFYEKVCTYGEDSYLWLQVILNDTVYLNPKPLMWNHTEASELGVGRKTPFPPWPMVLDPEPIFYSCPEQYRGLLRKIMDYYALLSIWRSIDANDLETPRKILKNFPTTDTLRWDYVKVRLKMRTPLFYSLCKRVLFMAKPASSKKVSRSLRYRI